MSKKPADAAFNGIVVFVFCICFFLALVGAMIPSIRVLFLCIFGIPCIPLVIILLKSSSSKGNAQDDEDSNSVNNLNLRNARQLGTDIVEAEFFNGCCGECAKYRGRWFSISGNDKRFPKMPTDYNCTCSGINFVPVIVGISEPSYCPKGVDIIKYSNRPFVDVRTPEEKEVYQHDLDYIVFNQLKEKDKKEYNRLSAALPREFPRTFSAYRNMKINETDNFLKLAEQVKATVGIDIRFSKSEKAIIDRYLKYEKKFNNR